jgi:LCP family protein required for cell wall assembly
MRPTTSKAPREGKRHVLRWVAVAAVAIVCAGTLTGYLKYRAVYDSITRVSVPEQALGDHRPPVYSTTSMNILVYGDDSRKGLTAHQQYILRTGDDQTDNTDTIMVVHISPGRHQVTVLSIPRDTMVPQYECDSSPGYAGQQADPGNEVMINSLLEIGGPTCLWKTVEQQTGIRIDHFIGIGMLGFVNVVNDLGGVNVCVPYRVNDPVSGLNLNSGEQHINAFRRWRSGVPERTSGPALTWNESSATSSCPRRWSKAYSTVTCCRTRSSCSRWSATRPPR